MEIDQPWQDLVLALKNMAKEKRITQKMISERTGIKQQAISRMFRLKHSPTVKTFMAVAIAVGISVELT